MSNEQPEQFWRVKLHYYRGPRTSWESGMDSAWPVGTSVLEIIADVARARDVDLTQCYEVSVERIEVR